jgi:hypothetical protein
MSTEQAAYRRNALSTGARCVDVAVRATLVGRGPVCVDAIWQHEPSVSSFNCGSIHAERPVFDRAVNGLGCREFALGAGPSALR